MLDGPSRDRAMLMQTRQRRGSTVGSMCILLPALFVIFLGVLAGAAFYRAYMRSQYQLRFHGYCGLPYENANSIDDTNLLIMINNKFREMNEETNRLDEMLK